MNIYPVPDTFSVGEGNFIFGNEVCTYVQDGKADDAVWLLQKRIAFSCVAVHADAEANIAFYLTEGEKESYRISVKKDKIAIPRDIHLSKDIY